MSEFKAEVIEIGKIEPHPDADRLEITYVHGGYPCIIGKGSFQEGDLAVYVPANTTVPISDPRFAFLAKTATADGRARVKALKLRGVFSMGLLIPPNHDWHLGLDAKDLLDVRRYEPPLAVVTDGPEDTAEYLIDLPKYTDIESWRKYPNLFQPDDEIICTEKIDGTNTRFLVVQDQLHVGARTWWVKETATSAWWMAAHKLGIYDKLKAHPGMMLVGETYGKVNVLRYGLTNDISFVAFDVFDMQRGMYLDYDAFLAFCRALEIPTAPELFRGQRAELDIAALTSSPSVLGNGTCIQEGCIVRPVKEQYDRQIGRLILKYHSEKYLLMG
jgi:RNA ligase (TIGR02306 family)